MGEESSSTEGLLLLRGPAVLIFGVAGVLLGVMYSLPRMEQVGRGVGAKITIASDVLPVTGAARLQNRVLAGAALLISLPVSRWAGAMVAAGA